MNQIYNEAIDSIGMFCRLHMKMKNELPIRSSEMGVLIFISKSKKEVTPLAISEFFRITKPSVTTMTSSLIKQRYLLKVPSSKDKRSYHLELTEKAHALIAQTSRDYFKIIDTLENEMGENDFQKLIELINKANSILKGVA